MSEANRDQTAPAGNSKATQPAAALSDRVRSLRLPAEEKGSTRRRSYLTWIPLVLIGLLAAFAVFQGLAAGANLISLQSNVDELSRIVKKEPIMPKGGAGQHGAAKDLGVPAGAVVLASKGNIVAFSQIQVSPKVGGMLTKLTFKEGQRVPKDFILAQIETVDFQADHDRAVAVAEAGWQNYREAYYGFRPEEIAVAKAELEEAESQREQLYLAYKRSGGLKTGGALAAQEYELAVSQFQSMDRRVEKLRLNYKLFTLGPRAERIDAALAEWSKALADVRKTKWRLDNCTVRAPVAGVILTKKAEEGSQVNPAAFSNGLSASLCDMADLTDMEVDLSIAERDLWRLTTHKKMKCQITTDAFPQNPPYKGYISRIMPIADRSKGAVPVRVKIIIPKDEEGKYLRPDMSAMVQFINEEWVDAPAEKKDK